MTSAPTRVACVTGASGDLGGAICRRLARQGGFVAVHAHRRLDVAAALAAELIREGGSAGVYEADLRSAEATDALVDRLIKEHGRIDVLVNNAGVIRDALLFAMSDEDLDAVLEVNLKAVFRLTRAAARHMMRQRSGVIVNISSAAAARPSRGQSNYAAAKAGLEGFTRAMAVELAPKGIRVNAVAPGVIEGEMTRAIRDAAGDQILDRLLIRRFGSPDDIAAAVAFLASADASYITGEVLHVDGGLR